MAACWGSRGFQVGLTLSAAPKRERGHVSVASIVVYAVRLVGRGLALTRGSALAAAYGRHHSSLRVTGNVVVGRGAVAIRGCKVNPDGSGFPCIEDPNERLIVGPGSVPSIGRLTRKTSHRSASSRRRFTVPATRSLSRRSPVA
jgi:hypothetical protein